MAPDEDVRKIAEDAMTRLNSLQGAEFDTAFADAQLRVLTAAVAQYGAYSQNGNERFSTPPRGTDATAVAVTSGGRQAASRQPLDSGAGDDWLPISPC